ncbi:MAG: hypothetical protein J7J61_06990 [Candidatus Hydrothermae bacterium]|nr:hypothetical protein [Candidatus Hydrothermae bacterium]
MPKSRLKIEGLQLSDIDSLQATKTELSIGIVNGVKVPSFVQEVVSPSLRVASSLQTDEVEYDTYVKWVITKAVQPTMWAKAYGGTSTDKSWGVAVADNGDIVVAGSTNSFGAGNSDVWVLKLGAFGSVVWQKAYGGSGNDIARGVATTSSGDIIIAGKTESFGDWIADAWVLRLDADGNIKWQKAYGGAGAGDEANAVVESGGDIIVAGHTYSFGAGSSDVLVVKLDENGDILWQKAYGGSGAEDAYGVAVADNGDIIVVGETESFGSGSYDILVLRLDGSGNIIWQKAFGGAGADFAHDVAVADNGDIVVVGQTSGSLLVLRLDEQGNIKWQKAYSGASDDLAYGVVIADNGDIIVAGRSNSFGNSSDYIWVLRLDENGNIVWQKAYGGTSDDLAYSVALASNGDIIVAGGTESFGAGIGTSDFIVLRLDEDGSLPVSELSVMDTNATVAPASCNVVDTNCTVTDINLTVTDTDCIVTETDCVVTEL